MTGMSRTTGAALAASSDAHLVQSIHDILTTPLGSRVLRRTYGSALADLVDQPMNARTRLLIFAATAAALLRWEPRLRLKQVAVQMAASGVASLTIRGVRTDRPRRQPVDILIPLQA